MKFRTFGFKHLSILLAVAALWFFGPPVLRFGICLVSDKCYRPREACSPDGSCVTIVRESKISVNSYIKTYFYTGSWFTLPLLNSNYVFFDDGAEFCFVSAGEGRYEIYTNKEPTVNNLEAYVRVHPLGETATGCISA